MALKGMMKAGATLAAATALVVGTAGAASAEPAGKYEYVCVSTSGATTSIAPGATCYGSYLQRYINGVHVDSVNLTAAGTPADPEATSCIIAVMGAGLAVVSLKSGGMLVVLSAGIAGWSLIDSCS